ncbi:MAG: carboxypeptidase-like regulatory domain-containing protein [Bacteroidales bacterium]
MKKIEKRINRYNGIDRVLNNYPLAFDGLSAATASRSVFSAKTTMLNSLLSQQAVPRTSLYQLRMTQQTDLQNRALNMTHIGVMLANRIADPTLLSKMNEYRNRLRPGSVQTLLITFPLIMGDLGYHTVILKDLGLGIEALEESQTLLETFRLTHNSLQNELDSRRNVTNNINSLLKECNAILKLELDRFVLFNRAAYPDLYSSYMNLRRQQRSKGSSSGSVADSDISGTITDAVTGLPILGAVLSFAERTDTCSTDSDGYFVLDELEAGTYTLGCHAPGYQSPEMVRLRLNESDSLIHNFSLNPAA